MSDEKKEKTEEELKAEQRQAEWDKQRQEAEQAQANYEKAAAARDELAGELETTNVKVAELEEQLKEAKREKAETDKLDPDLVDRSVITNIEKIQSELNSTKEELGSLKKKAAQYEQVELEREKQKLIESNKERVLKPLDEEFGAKYRNEAVKLAQEHCDKQGKPFADAIEARDFFRKTYKTLKDKDESSKKDEKESVRTDTGEGGLSFNEGEIKEGSIEDVWSQIKKKQGNRPFTMPTTG